MDRRKGLSYEDYLLHQEEVVRRAKALKDRLLRLEWPASTASPETDAALTAIGAMYAALTLLLEHNVSLALVIQLTGFFYMVADDMKEDALLDAVNKALLLRVPTPKGPM